MMQTILIVLDPGKLDPPDLDLCCRVPERVEEVTHGAVRDNGYDYINAEEGHTGPLLGIWLAAESADEGWPRVVKLLREESFLGNDLSRSARIYISENDGEELEHCAPVYPALS